MEMGVECSFEGWVRFTYVGLRKENNSGSERNMSKLRGRDKLCTREEVIVRHAWAPQRACVR